MAAPLTDPFLLDPEIAIYYTSWRQWLARVYRGPLGEIFERLPICNICMLQNNSQLRAKIIEWDDLNRVADRLLIEHTRALKRVSKEIQNSTDVISDVILHTFEQPAIKRSDSIGR